MVPSSCIYPSPWVGHGQLRGNARADGGGQAEQRCLCVLLGSCCQVSRPIGTERSFKDSRAFACPSAWGGLTASDSPDVESPGKLRSSSATQEKLQYPLGVSAAILPVGCSPAKTERSTLLHKLSDYYYIHSDSCISRSFSSRWRQHMWVDETSAVSVLQINGRKPEKSHNELESWRSRKARAPIWIGYWISMGWLHNYLRTEFVWFSLTLPSPSKLRLIITRSNRSLLL